LKIALQEYFRIAFELEDEMFFCSFILLNLNALDFTWVTMPVTKTSNWANLVFMVLKWLGIDLVVDLLLTFHKTLALININDL
jgi:hypothetical protein